MSFTIAIGGQVIAGVDSILPPPESKALAKARVYVNGVEMFEFTMNSNRPKTWIERLKEEPL